MTVASIWGLVCIRASCLVYYSAVAVLQFLMTLNIPILHQALQITELVLALVECRLLGPSWAQMNQNLGGEIESSILNKLFSWRTTDSEGPHSAWGELSRKIFALYS